MAHFVIEHLTFAYPGAASNALEDVTLSVVKGEYLTICGKSGCGKTTLLRHLKSVLAPHGKVQGKVLFEDVPLGDVSQRDQSAKIGFVMQNPDSQVVTDKVWHELAFGLESLGCDQRTMRLRVAEMASYFGIQAWFHKDVRELSGGQKQLLNLASIMAMQPSVLILDEPTSQLDPIAAADFLNTVRKINLELGTTVILTEHRLEEVFSCADRVVVMDAGRVVIAGDPRTVGDMIHEQSDDMLLALPTPLRIFYGVSDGIDDSVSVLNGTETRSEDKGGKVVPLTVREGRAWLSDRTSSLSFRTLELEEDPLPEDGAFDVAISLKDVWFRYGKNLPDVLRGMSVEIPTGSLFAIVGGNGVGKSTALKVMSGIARPYRGIVRIQGKKVKDWKGASLFRECLAVLPQDPQNLFVKKTVRDDLLEMLAGEHLSQSEKDERIAHVIKTVDVERLLDAHPFDLSGGEQQRAALAKVLLTKPKILLLDEPTKGIDCFFKAKLAELFSNLQQTGVTIVMVSHDIEFCAQHADMVSMLFDGSIVTTNTPHRFFSQNSFYTTAANRMSRQVFRNAITDEDVISLCTI